VNNVDQLNTNWGFGTNENLYNQEILNASANSGVPAWVLKGLIAVESRFNPNSVSSSAAYGLMQITGNGMSALFESNANISKAEIETAWKLMSLTEQGKADQALFPSSPPASAEEIQAWFKNLHPTLKATLNNYTLSSIDGKCTPADIAVDRCSQESQFDNKEVQKNVTYGAMILNASLKDIEDIMSNNGIPLDSVSESEKWKMAIANYNLSVGSGQYLRPAIQACAGNFSWSCVSNQLVNNPDTHLAPGYAEKVVNFAQQGCEP
jgi:hypothetical protein